MVDAPEAAALALLESPHNTPGYLERLRDRGALAGLDYDDARQVAATIIGALMFPGGAKPGAMFGPTPTPDLHHSANALRQKAANVACGSDLVRSWHDRAAVSNAFTTAADALNIDAQPFSPAVSFH